MTDKLLIRAIKTIRFFYFSAFLIICILSAFGGILFFGDAKIEVRNISNVHVTLFWCLCVYHALFYYSWHKLDSNIRQNSGPNIIPVLAKCKRELKVMSIVVGIIFLLSYFLKVYLGNGYIQ